MTSVSKGASLHPAAAVPASAGSGRLIVVLQWLLMGVVVAGFAYYGFKGVVTGRSRRTLGGAEFNSADRFLLEALHVDGGAEKIVDSLSGLPPLGPIAIAAPDDNVYGPLLLQAIGAITWPHPIYFVAVGNGQLGKTFGVLRAHHFAAVLLYDPAPPVPNADGRRVGLLTVIPIPQ